MLLGAAVFAAGLALAFRRLPEWRAAPMPPPAGFVERFEELSGRLSFRPSAGGRPRRALVNHALRRELSCAPQQPGAPPTTGTYGVCVEVRQDGELAGYQGVRELALYFSSEGRPRAALWWSGGNLAMEPESSSDQMARFARLLAYPGEKLSPPRNVLLEGVSVTFYDLIGSAPAEHLQIFGLTGDPSAARAHGTAADWIARRTAPRGQTGMDLVTSFFVLGVCALFLVLVGKRHVDVVNGGILAGITLATLLPETFSHSLTPISNLALPSLFLASKVLWIFLVWSVGESLLRSYQPTFTTSLDSLRAGRVGPRGGRALLSGLALGAILAGAHLALLSLAMNHPAIWPGHASLTLPLTGLGGNSFGRSIALAGTVLLLLAAFLRVLPARWASLAAAVAVVFCWPLPFSLHNIWVELAVEIAFAAVLVGTLRAFGLTALLTASVSFYLLPAAVYSSLNLSWMPWAFAGTVGVTATFLILGLIGLCRPPSVEEQRLTQPAFMRRREEERRIRYEMDLLARMQKGLLPESVPDLPGWDIAARSILATEAGGDLYDFLFDEDGRLWVAVGDVAGHGYSCAIVQAMTTAALTSLIRPGLRPSEVLVQVDRVIRRGGSSRNFATLALLRLDPQTGEVVIANAGHPFPLLILDNDVSEIVLPGLPLGKGPQRIYLDITLHLPPGAALVFCSDGLMETQDWQETPYGFDRPLEILRHAPSAPAASILDILLADWRRHLGTEEPPDDTTIVVVRRAG